MRIVHANNFMIRRYGLLKVSTDRKFSNGMIRNNWKVCEYSDRDIAKYEALLNIKPLGIKAANKRFIQSCDNFKPDCILIGACDIISNESIKKIKKLVPETKIIYFNVDPPWRKVNIEKIHHRKQVADAIFMTTGGELLKQFCTGLNIVAFVPNATDPAVEDMDNSQKNSDQLEYDLSYCGRGNKTDSRYPVIVSLHEKLKEKLNFQTFGIYGNPCVYGQKYDEVLSKSKMSLNLNREEGWHLYSSDRISQLVGNGILTFLWDKGEMRKFLSDEHVVFFKDQDELEEKIIEFHNDDQKRKAIAHLGRQFYHENFSSQKITKFMIETVFQVPYSENYLWQEEVYK